LTIALLVALQAVGAFVGYWLGYRDAHRRQTKLLLGSVWETKRERERAINLARAIQRGTR